MKILIKIILKTVIGFNFDPLTIGAIGLGIGAVSSLANTALGFSNYAWQRGLQSDIFSREDNSIQRRVADLKAAGMSPVLAAGQGAGTGGIVSTQAPQFDNTFSSQLNQVLGLMEMKQRIAVSETQQELMSAQKLKTDMETVKTAGEITLQPYQKSLLNAQRQKTKSDAYSQVIQGLRESRELTKDLKTGFSKSKDPISTLANNIAGLVVEPRITPIQQGPIKTIKGKVKR